MNEAIRQRLKRAAAALLDKELHERLWLRGDRYNPSEESFDDVVLFVIDELASVPSQVFWTVST